jgi:hypothetical protein
MEDGLEQAKQVEKLYLEVVEDTLNLGGQAPIKIWLRPMRYPVEKTRALMANRETYNLMKSDGSEDEDAIIGGYCALRLMTVFYSVRKTEKPDSPRLFESLRQAGSVNPQELDRLFIGYQESFEMSEDDLGNSLRAKTNS